MFPANRNFVRFYTHMMSCVPIILAPHTHRVISHCSPVFVQGWVVGKDWGRAMQSPFLTPLRHKLLQPPLSLAAVKSLCTSV